MPRVQRPVTGSEFGTLAVIIIALAVVSIVLNAGGCALLGAKPTIEGQRIATSQPVEVTNLAGAVNVQADVEPEITTDVGGITGVSIFQALPTGAVILMGLMLLAQLRLTKSVIQEFSKIVLHQLGISHEREMKRINRTNRGDAPEE